MSGHSKWATTKRQKAITDKKRATIFTKLSIGIAAAARQGGENPDTNFKLRLLIDQAKGVNMSKDVIERAVKRGTGVGEEAPEEIIYEGFGPGGTALVIEALTSNRNRTTGDLRHLFNMNGGNLGSSGTTLWMFDHKGVLKIANRKSQIANLEEFELQAIDGGADDIKEEDDELTILTAPENLQKVKEGLEKQGIKIDYAGLEWFAKNPVVLDKETRAKLDALAEALEENPDVSDYYTSAA